MHTDSTLEHLQSLTKEFGRLMREFRDQTCSQFETVELPREAAARNRNQQRVLAISSSGQGRHMVTPIHTSSADGRDAASVTGTNANTSSGLVRAQLVQSELTRKVKTLNISTTKFHFLADYVRTIQMFGCTDSYSTQLVCHSTLCTRQTLTMYLPVIGRTSASASKAAVWKNE